MRYYVGFLQIRSPIKCPDGKIVTTQFGGRPYIIDMRRARGSLAVLIEGTGCGFWAGTPAKAKAIPVWLYIFITGYETG